MTKLAYTACSVFPSYAARRFLHPSGYGTLGFALSAAIGAAIACPDRAVVAIIGDGGLQFTLPELACAAELGRALVVLVYDNNGNGMIRDGMERANIPAIGVDPSGPNLALVARAFDAIYLEAADPASLASAIGKAVQHPGLSLVRFRDA
ncbi:hypothetical protein SLNSH_17315 [Alsobacter soli]|uniref:Thiamine pyrophosphate enzyme TPP-binding domain-containing protein n=2 Tax=Alsobacter soli TaxID=2109933 RepID=A0A2T1HQ51_9HYPH|nr:hypothetical protein SLNSH_17315 [Alsobacter soli]